MPEHDSRRKTYRQRMQILNNLALIGQMGLSFAMPLLLCLFACHVLCTRFSVGYWVYIPGFFFGLGGSFATALKVYTAVTSKNKNRQDKKTKAYNRHI